MKTKKCDDVRKAFEIFRTAPRETQNELFEWLVAQPDVRRLMAGQKARLWTWLRPLHGEDLSQETLMTLHRALLLYDGRKIDNPLAWLWLIFSRTTASFLRKIHVHYLRGRVFARENETSDDALAAAAGSDPAGDPEAAYLGKAALEEALKKIDALDARQARAIRMRLLEDRSLAETARTLGISPSRVSQLVARGVSKIASA